MTKMGKEIIEGLKSAVSYMDGSANKAKFKVHQFKPVQCPKTVDVKSIRTSLGLSQAMFAISFGLSLSAIRNWEQGKRKPDPAARAYLTIIGRNPKAVQRALT